MSASPSGWRSRWLAIATWRGSSGGSSGTRADARVADVDAHPGQDGDADLGGDQGVNREVVVAARRDGGPHAAREPLTAVMHRAAPRGSRSAGDRSARRRSTPSREPSGPSDATSSTSGSSSSSTVVNGPGSIGSATKRGVDLAARHELEQEPVVGPLDDLDGEVGPPRPRPAAARRAAAAPPRSGRSRGGAPAAAAGSPRGRRGPRLNRAAISSA